MSKLKSSYLFFVLILVASFLLMLFVSFQESATMDELAHIPSGYSYMRYLDYRLNPEHPPLVKAFSAVPLLFMGLNFPTTHSSWTNDINGQWEAGNQFIYKSGNNAEQLIFWARIGPILLTLLLIALIYFWARELLGDWWGLLPTFLFAFSPTVLAHGHYVTTDIGAALGVVLGTYFFLKFLLKPNAWHLVFAGLALGVAALAKFSTALLIPYFFLLTLIWIIRNYFHSRQVKRDQNLSEKIPACPAGRKFCRWSKIILVFEGKFWSLLAIFIIAYVSVYLVYFAFTLNYPIAKQVADTQSILTSFKHRLFADIDIWMAGNKFLRPLAHYLLGVLMAGQRSVNGNTAYFLGGISAAGWWYYFPVVFFLKEPIPSLILILMAFSFCLWIFFKDWKFPSALKAKSYKLKAVSDYLGTHLPEFSMFLFIVFYWLYSMQSKLNIGVRHILPTLPFIYILTTAGLKNWVNSHFGDYSSASAVALKNIPQALKAWFCRRRISAPREKKILPLEQNYSGSERQWRKPYHSFKVVLIFLFLFWYLLEMVWAYPFYLSYFNQFGGGVFGGYRYVTDSNYDWGQDLKRLKNFLETWNMEHEAKIDKIAVDYFGGGDVKYCLGDKSEIWWSSRGNPKDIGIEWLAVSVNALQSAIAKPAPGFERKPEDEYRWLQEIKNPLQPDLKAGTSIFIYKL